MTATWNTPATWAAYDAPSSTKLNNTSGNVDYIARSRPFDLAVTQDSGTDYSLTSTSWADADATNLKVVVVTQVDLAKVHLVARFIASCANNAFFDWHDGTNYSAVDEVGNTMGSNGVAAIQNSSRQQITVESFFVNVAAGTHTYTLRYKVSSTALTIFKSSYPIQKWGREEG